MMPVAAAPGIAYRSPRRRKKTKGGISMSSIRKIFVASVAAMALASLAEPASPQGLLKANRLSAALATELAAAAVEACVKLNQEVTVVVLDISGVHQAMIRGDGAGIHTIDTAHHKAYTAMTFKTDTIDLVARSKKGSAPSAINIVPNLLLAQGGVLVRAGDEIIAAIGVSGARGGDMDTQCARAGIERIRDRLR
jgi:uncharacterized protein GlcG (DUF336 family)